MRTQRIDIDVVPNFQPLVDGLRKMAKSFERLAQEIESREAVAAATGGRGAAASEVEPEPAAEMEST